MDGATIILNLEQARKRSGVSLESIANSTKISSRFLRAIETEEFEKLPGGIFDTNYIRQYASAIGFSHGQILAVYQARTALQVNEPVPAAKPVRTWSLRSCFSWLVNVSSAERC